VEEYDVQYYPPDFVKFQLVLNISKLVLTISH